MYLDVIWVKFYGVFWRFYERRSADTCGYRLSVGQNSAADRRMAAGSKTATRKTAVEWDDAICELDDLDDCGRDTLTIWLWSGLLPARPYISTRLALSPTCLCKTFTEGGYSLLAARCLLGIWPSIQTEIMTSYRVTGNKTERDKI